MNNPPATGPRRSAGPGGPAGPNDRPTPRFQLSGRRWLVLIGLVILFDIVFYSIQAGVSSSSTPQTTISYTTLVTQAQKHNIKTATVSDTDAHGDFVKPYKFNGKSYL